MSVSQTGCMGGQTKSQAIAGKVFSHSFYHPGLTAQIVLRESDDML
jgi:hypothetical protein